MKKIIFFIFLFINSFCFCQSKNSGISDKSQVKSDSTDTIAKQGNENVNNASSKSTSTDTLGINITYLNAANFDFSGKLSTTYMGIFKIFAPNINNSPWGFIAGIEKINYSPGNINGNDSTQVEYFTQNFLLNPIDHISYNPSTGIYNLNYIQQGAKYVQQYNQFSYKTANTVWSFYAEPMWRFSTLNSNDGRQGLYFHAHAELLVNQWTRTVNIKNLQQNPDTLIVISPTQSPQNFYWVANNPIISNYNFLTGYFGGGATVYINPINGCTTSHLFAQATFGFAINSPNLDALNNPQLAPAENGTYPSNDVTNSHAKGFYLIRMSFIQSMSSSSQLVIGGIFRGIFPAQTPQYAVFLGINLDLGAVIKLIASES